MRGESRWGERFLGLSSLVDMSQVPINDELAKRVLAYGKQAKFDVTQGMIYLDIEREEAHTTPGQEKLVDKARILSTPTLEMMDGEEPVPQNPVFNLLPLKRLLKRAVLADMMDPKNGPALRADARRRYYENKVLEEIRKVEKEMIPER